MLFRFLWLVTRDWWLGSHSSLIICRFEGFERIRSFTISSSHANRGVEVYKRDDSFLHLPDCFKVGAHNPALTDSEATLSGLGFMSLYILKRKNEGKNEHSHVRFWLILVRQWKVGCFQLAICSDRLLTAFCKRLTSHLSLYLYNQKFYAKNEHFED